MALWAGIATREQAASNNPSCWLDPVWGISNYLPFRGLLKYGYVDEVRELCEKTIQLFGRDIIRFGYHCGSLSAEQSGHKFTLADGYAKFILTEGEYDLT